MGDAFLLQRLQLPVGFERVALRPQENESEPGITQREPFGDGNPRVCKRAGDLGYHWLLPSPQKPNKEGVREPRLNPKLHGLISIEAELVEERRLFRKPLRRQ